MATTTQVVDDPYNLTPEGIKEPPTGWRQSFGYLGPGLIVTASIVGSGELIATTTLGAQVGFVILWFVIVSTLVKVAVQVELARWTISTGQPALTGYNKVPPKIGRIGWVNITWLVLFLAKNIQYGGIVGGVAIAFSLLVPIGGEPLGFTSLLVWTAIVVFSCIVFLYSNRYGLIERVAGLLIVLFVLFTVVIAAGLPFTPFAYDPGELLGGFTFTIPAGALGAALAMFGITGISVNEITWYTYWCIEKGYARWAGPPDGSDEWARRANGWIRVMYKDVFLSWIVYTFATLAFFIMGAAVLHPQGLVPEDNEMLTTLSRMYTDTLGEWASVGFLIGAIAVLGSTLWAAVPSWARTYTDFLGTLDLIDWNDPSTRLKWIRIFTVLLPILWGAVYLYVSEPVLMVQIGGVVSGIVLLGVVVAAWYLRRTETDPRLYGSTLFNTFLIVSTVALGLVALYSALEVFGVGG
ncbi:MAG: Nramp family divalent metal transporter [Carbonactinosporaceae bacterium]